MPIIKCPECGNDVSDQATACPHCGNPRSATAVAALASTAPPQLIEQTHKKWKIVKLVAFLIAIFSIVLIVSGLQTKNSATVGFGILLLLIGIVISFVGKFGAWWSNG